MNGNDFNLMVVGFEALLAFVIAGTLLSASARMIPRWHRFLIATASASLFAQAVFILSEPGGSGPSARSLSGYASDLGVGALTLVILALLLGGHCTPIARISRTSRPSGPRPTA